MIVKAILVGLIAGLGKIDNRLFGMTMLQRPLFMGTLVGIVYGDLIAGMKIGAQIELLSMGVVGIGAHSSPPDVTIGGALCTAFALGSGTGTEVALALAIPVSAFATSIGYLTHIPLNHLLSEKAKKAAAIADTKTMIICQWGGLFNYFIFPALITMVAVMAGGPAFEYLIKVIPTFITDGMQVAAGMLPALGFALLMQLTYSKQMAPYLFVGFILAAFLSMSNIGVAAVGAVLAVFAFNAKNSEGQQEEESYEI